MFGSMCCMVYGLEYNGVMEHTVHHIAGHERTLNIIQAHKLAFSHRLQESGVSVGDEGSQILGQGSKFRASHEELVPGVHEHGEGYDEPVALLAACLERKRSGS